MKHEGNPYGFHDSTAYLEVVTELKLPTALPFKEEESALNLIVNGAYLPYEGESGTRSGSLSSGGTTGNIFTKARIINTINNQS